MFWGKSESPHRDGRRFRSSPRRPVGPRHLCFSHPWLLPLGSDRSPHDLLRSKVGYTSPPL
jgi:hypothetical protein